MRSLQAQLITGLLVSLVVVFALQFSAMHFAIPLMVETSISHKLTEDADELFAAMNLDGRKGASIHQPDAAFIANHVGQYHEVFVDRDKLYASQTLAGASLGVPPPPGNTAMLRRMNGPGGNLLLVHAKGYESQGRQIHIAVATDLARPFERIDRFLWGFSVLSGVMLLLLMLMQTWIVRKGLKALAIVRAELVKVRHGAVHAVNEYVPAEVLPLVREVNQLSQTMTQRLQRSREILGNFAHAFKTPLTVLAQLAHDERLHDRPDIARTLTQQVGRLRGRVNLELKRARLAGRGGFAQPLDVCSEVHALAKTIALIYREKNLDIVCSTPLQAQFHGDREDMLELFGNLLDNACKYGRHRVKIAVEEDRMAAALRLVFEDDGPGCAPEHFEQLTQRGARFSPQAEGDGLGLTIAAEIVSSYSGTLRFSKSETLGGLRVCVELPFEHLAAPKPALPG